MTQINLSAEERRDTTVVPEGTAAGAQRGTVAGGRAAVDVGGGGSDILAVGLVPAAGSGFKL